MMNELKDYQKQAIDTMNQYLDRIQQMRRDGDKSGDENPSYNMAFYAITNKPYVGHDIDAPFVCITMPTGGGKTLTACYILHVLHQKYIKNLNDVGLVMWMVPTDAILEQTIKALRDTQHPYRQTLSQAFKNILIFDIDEALTIKQENLRNNLCIIVSTFASFRIEDRDKRHVFRENGSLMEHFDNDDEIPSLNNVIKLYHPIVVLDEGHHTKTDLSYEMIRRFEPAFVVEYTATPRMQRGQETNVLVKIDPQQLKDEDMVKIPIEHTNRTDWKSALDDGIAKRIYLERLCTSEQRRTRHYIRPIALIQAERDNPSESKVDVCQIRQYLLSKGIAKEEIAIRTGTKDELKNKKLDSPYNKIRYIITVKALAEGWDSAFAYVLISVANQKSDIAIKQIIGRVLRMPYQQRRNNNELNHAYVYTCSSRFDAVINLLQEGLVDNGYDIRDLISDDYTTQVDRIAKIRINDNDIKLPCIAIRDDVDHLLEYEGDLVGSDFSLMGKDIPKIADLADEEGRVMHDIGGIVQHQTTLPASREARDDLESYFMAILKRKVRRKWCPPTDMEHYLHRTIDENIHEPESRMESIIEFLKDVHTVVEIINAKIDEHEQDQAKNQFGRLLEKNRLFCRFKDLSSQMNVTRPIEPNNYQKHLYDLVGDMDEEESRLAYKIDPLPQIKWWYRNPVRNDNSFYIQGWKNRQIYPDFIIKTNSGQYFIVEYKGKMLQDTPDTKYKEKLIGKLSNLTGNDYDIRMVFGESEMNKLVHDIMNTSQLI